MAEECAETSKTGDRSAEGKILKQRRNEEQARGAGTEDWHNVLAMSMGQEGADSQIQDIADTQRQTWDVSCSENYKPEGLRE